MLVKAKLHVADARTVIAFYMLRTQIILAFRRV
jgi:hypothetical protein